VKAERKDPCKFGNPVKKVPLLLRVPWRRMLLMESSIVMLLLPPAEKTNKAIGGAMTGGLLTGPVTMLRDPPLGNGTVISFVTFST
jgi:hypothetical protein